MSLPIPKNNPLIELPPVSEEDYMADAGADWRENADLLATGEWGDEDEDGDET